MPPPMSPPTRLASMGSRSAGEKARRARTVRGSRREALDLVFDVLQHIFFRAVGNVTIGPGYVFACGSAGGIEQGGLGEEDERLG